MGKKSFFDHPYYKLNKMFLSNLGTWPEQSLLMRCLMPLLIWSFLMSVIIPEIINIPNILRRHDIDGLMDCIAPFFVMAMGFMQLFNGCFNRANMYAMLDRVSSDWKRLGQSPNIEIIHKHAARGHFITKTYSAGMYFACFFYLLMPLFPIALDYVVPLNESRKRNVLFEAEYGVDPDRYYWPILAHLYLTSVVVILVIISSDVMFFAMVEHACALFEIVGVNLTMVKKRSLTDGDSIEDEGYGMICHCVDLHREAITFADLIESTYAVCLLVVIGSCLILLSLSGVQTVMHIDEPEQTLRYGSFSIAQIFHLYFNSVPGQKIMDYSLSIFDYAYQVDWNDLSPKAQRLLLMIMMRSLRQCQITAGKVYVVSMENYSSVMQTSMSYFTVLSSMR